MRLPQRQGRWLISAEPSFLRMTDLQFVVVVTELTTQT
jgi:hypothetical protein